MLAASWLNSNLPLYIASYPARHAEERISVATPQFQSRIVRARPAQRTNLRKGAAAQLLPAPWPLLASAYLKLLMRVRAPSPWLSWRWRRRGWTTTTSTPSSSGGWTRPGDWSIIGFLPFVFHLFTFFSFCFSGFKNFLFRKKKNFLICQLPSAPCVIRFLFKPSCAMQSLF